MRTASGSYVTSGLGRTKVITVHTTEGPSKFITLVIGSIGARRFAKFTLWFFVWAFLGIIEAALGPTPLVASIIRSVRTIRFTDNGKSDFAFRLYLGAFDRTLETAFRSTKSIAPEIWREGTIRLAEDGNSGSIGTAIQLHVVVGWTAVSLETQLSAFGVRRTRANRLVTTTV